MVASWYGKAFHGKKTASGEIFNMYAYTAAHKTLPLGTILKVTNPETGKSVVVKVNDRGPYVRGRDLDLSYAAAKKIGLTKKGVGKVYVEILNRSPNSIKKVRYSKRFKRAPKKGPFTVQVGAFTEKSQAYKLKYLLSERYDTIVFVQRTEKNGKIYYRVRVGRFFSLRKATSVAEKLAQEGYPVMILSLEEDNG